MVNSPAMAQEKTERMILIIIIKKKGKIILGLLKCKMNIDLKFPNVLNVLNSLP